MLAFDCFSDHYIRFQNGEFDLVSSENHKFLEFLSTEVIPKFFINKTAVELFEHLFVELSEMRNQLIDGPLIVTGQGLGGYLAILFTLLHLHAIDVEETKDSETTKRPLCLTFGSPLVGDEALQCAISEHPQWKSSFLNVVVKTDPVASFFKSNTPYKPFGTFLFCTESGKHTAFEDPDAILAVLDAMESLHHRNPKIHDYRKELGSIGGNVLYRGVSDMCEFNLNPFREGIALQIMEIGVSEYIPNDLIPKMEDKKAKMIKKKEKEYEPMKKLNVRKINLAYMEWYMKTTRSKGGYYDFYKNAQSIDEITRKQEIVKSQRWLNQYWKEFIEEKNRMPQKEGVKLRKRWLYSGTNYRRIVEPLDIADYYKSGKTNYISNRPKHYELLEKWWNYEKDQKPNGGKTKAASLTEDSCFWAHVEEALISLSRLKNGGSGSVATDMEVFEVYVLCGIKDYSVSPDVFLDGSSLMMWWREYDTYRGSSYDSELARYMKDERYKLYQ